MTTATPTPGLCAIDVPRSETTFTTKHMFGLGTVRGGFPARRTGAAPAALAENLAAGTVRLDQAARTELARHFPAGPAA